MSRNVDSILEELKGALSRRSASDVYDLAYSLEADELAGFIRTLPPNELAFLAKSVEEMRLQFIDLFSNSELAAIVRRATAGELVNILSGTGWRAAAVLRELSIDELAELLAAADVPSAVFILRHSGDNRDKLLSRYLLGKKPMELREIASRSSISDIVFLVEHGGHDANGILKNLSVKVMKAKIHGADGHQVAFLISSLGKTGEELVEELELTALMDIIRDSAAADFLTILNASGWRRHQILSKLSDGELNRLVAGGDAASLTELMKVLGERRA